MHITPSYLPVYPCYRWIYCTCILLITYFRAVVSQGAEGDEQKHSRRHRHRHSHRPAVASTVSTDVLRARALLLARQQEGPAEVLTVQACVLL